MKCHECIENLSAHIDNRLTLEEQKEIELHLKDCPSCAQELESLKFIVENISTLQEQEIPATLHGDIMKQINKEITREKTKEKNIIPFKTWTKYIASIAATVLIVIVLTDIIKMGGQSPKMSASETQEMASTEAAEESTLSNDSQPDEKLAADAPMLAAEAPMLKRTVEDDIPSENKADSSIQAAQTAKEESLDKSLDKPLNESFEEWEITSSEKEKIIAAIKDYSDKSNMQAEYLLSEPDISSIIIYKILSKEEFLEVLYKIDNHLQITKKAEGGENLKIIIK